MPNKRAKLSESDKRYLHYSAIIEGELFALLKPNTLYNIPMLSERMTVLSHLSPSTRYDSLAANIRQFILDGKLKRVGKYFMLP